MKIWGIIDCAIAIIILYMSGYMPKKWMTAVLILCTVCLFCLGSVLILNSFCE